ncbi:hypothetical protein [Nocardia sp. Marseille-Q1738]
MSDKLLHDSDDMRRTGANERADSAEPYNRGKGDPDWEGKIEAMFGNAAHGWNQASKYYMKVSNAAHTKIGDDKVAVGDTADSVAPTIDNVDVDGGAGVRRAGPQA